MCPLSTYFYGTAFIYQPTIINIKREAALIGLECEEKGLGSKYPLSEKQKGDKVRK